jgi:Putative peptidoglycan binding domain
MESTRQSSVFFYDLVPAEGRSPAELELRLRELSGFLTLAARPRLSPLLFSHRVLRRGGGCAWEIVFTGIDLPEVEDSVPVGSIGGAITAEVRERLRGLAEIVFASEYEDISPSAAGATTSEPSDASGISFAGGDVARWEDYLADARTEAAGRELPVEIVGAIQRARSALPVEHGLKPWGKGHMYSGANDRAHLAYVKSYLAALADRAMPADRRKILAFLAFQGREGSTAAINTYDNQIVTWGTGWSGLGAMGKVVERALRSPAVSDLFARCGVRYRGKNEYDVVDVERRSVVRGRAPALEVIRSSVALLRMLIHASREPMTRDAVTAAQLETFMAGSANLPGAEAIATQALFNLVAHLKHWAPAYVDGLDRVFPQAGDGPPSEERDRRLAALVARYFYARARRTGWLPDWKQFQMYWRHMKDDGLDCLEDPVIQAPGPPGAEDSIDLLVAGGARAGGQAPAAAAKALKSPPIAGDAELDDVLRGGTALRRGTKGTGVARLQEALAMLGVEVRGGVDGAFGAGTEAAVLEFQRNHDLGVDGVVGGATLRVLDAELAGRAR